MYILGVSATETVFKFHGFYLPELWHQNHRITDEG